MSQQDQFHEDSFCPVTCNLSDLAAATRAAPEETRRAFLMGVWFERVKQQMEKAGLAADFLSGQDHFQIIHAAACCFREVQP